jgi:magnesium transporter
MLKGLFARPGRPPEAFTSAGRIPELLREKGGCLWVDFEAPTEEERRVMETAFGFHPVALESCWAHANHPRLQDYGDYLYIVLHAVRGALPLETDEIDAFLGRTFLVTSHERPMAALEEVYRRAGEVESVLRRGPDRLLAELADRITEDCVGAIERLDDAMDGLEERLFRGPGRAVLREVLSFKKDVLHLRRIVGPQREVLGRLARMEFPQVTREEAVYLRDVYDQTVRVAEMLEAFRDVLASAMEVYLSVISNRINEVMRTLTVFSIILMSTSLVAGIYGMNVDLLRTGTKADFYLLLGVMGAIAAGLLGVFRRRGWI